MNGDFTPIQKRMLAVLADGMYHRPEELHACLDDELGPISNIWAHLTSLRKKLWPKGQDIACEQRRDGCYYRHIRLVYSPAE